MAKTKVREKIVFDFSRLLGKIIERYGTRQSFADAIGITPTTIGSKLDGDRTWTQDEIIAACDLLGIEYTDIPSYFFVRRVEKTQLEEVAV